MSQQLDFTSPGHHEVQLDGTYVIHVWGGAGGDGNKGTSLHGSGGYACWRGELTDEVTMYVASSATGGAGGASTIVQAASIVDTHPHFDMSGYLAVAGGGGGAARNYDHRGGDAGIQTAPVGQDIYGAWHGQSGNASGPIPLRGHGGGNGIGGSTYELTWNATGGADGVGGPGGRVHDRNDDHSRPGTNGYPGGGSGSGGQADVDERGRLNPNEGGGGGGGFGGGGGGATTLEDMWTGAGGGGGSYVGPSATPCTQTDIDNAPAWDTREGGRVVIVPVGTVVDPVTGLEWSAQTYTGSWDTAMAHNEAHGYTDWRLPTPEELRTLYPLDPIKFAGWPGTSQYDSFYWTSETMEADPQFARVIDFATGGAPSYLKPKNFVSYRLVRTPTVVDPVTGLEWSTQTYTGSRHT